MIDDTLRMRDLLILQNELEDRSRKGSDRKLRGPGGAELLAMVLDQYVPPRLQLSEDQWIRRMMKLKGLPKRVLLKQLYEGWPKLGRPRPRGYVFPDLSRTKRAIEQCMAVGRELEKLPLPSDMRPREWERSLAQVILHHSRPTD